MSRPARAPRRHLDGILLLDKPLGISSNRALQDARRLFNADKAGHTGSLDPLATGLLPICFGEGTKLCGLLLDASKRYVATVHIGALTSTGDTEGEVLRRSDASTLTVGQLEAAVPGFLGRITQVPPMYSALKVDGRRLYELARAGEEVERAPREVVIESLEVLDYRPGQLQIDVRCSKGTYIRTLVEDLLATVGQCAHLSALRRTEVDPFVGKPMWSLEALDAMGEGRDRVLLPLASALEGWPTVTLEGDPLRRMGRGQAVVPDRPMTPDEAIDIAVLDACGHLQAIARVDSQGRLAPRRWLGGPGSA